MNDKSSFRYRREDFTPLPARLDHLDISLSFIDGKVEADQIIHMTAVESLSSISLDARGLEVSEIELFGEEPLQFAYDTDKNRIDIELPEPVLAGADLKIRTVTSCVPSENILEGIYTDTTPEGCPQQYMSQCQQWGFQRIMPTIDDCRAKCTMRTTVEADARYTHLISNGDVDRTTNPEGIPVSVDSDDTRQAITYVNNIPMAPYLFIVCVGTWDVLEDEVQYPSGRKVKLEYLVPPGRTEGAAVPMAILKDSVLWQGETQEYEYEREVYRTICMEKSNFGGMENVGNTTIVTDAALVDEFTGDRRLQYAHAVVVHEFEHNQCGSDVTMETPFDMWLNEAYTVDVERQFMASRFNPVCERLDEVDTMRSPVGGPLAIEDAGVLGNIVREGFNDPDELVDAVTYTKAAEVVRMLRLIIGEASYVKARNLYFSRHLGGNANTNDFFACFEEASGRDLAQFRQEWLHSIGYPVIEAESSYNEDSGCLEVSITQSRVGKGGLFHLPLAVAAVDEAGRDIAGASQVVEITAAKHSFEFDCGSVRPAIISMNRDCSFYGTFTDRAVSEDDLVKQVRLDSSLFNRVEAMRRLTDVERIRLLNDPTAAVSESWLALYGEILGEDLPPGVKSYLLTIQEQSLDRSYLTWYRELCDARETLMHAVAAKHWDALKNEFDSIDTYKVEPDPCDGIEKRRLKAVLLRIMVSLDNEEAQRLAEAHFRAATNISDRMSGLMAVYLTDHPDRMALMDEGYEMWRGNIGAYSGYLTMVGQGSRDDVFDMIKREELRPGFVLEHPSFSRSLFVPFGHNNRMLWTDQGIAWLADTVVRLAGINEYTAVRLVTAFQQVHRLKDDLRGKVLAALESILARLDRDKAPSVYGRVESFIRG